MGPRAGVLLAIFCTVANAQIPSPKPPADPQATIDGLREITRQLNDSVRRFYAELDRTMGLRDRGYKARDGKLRLSADADLNTGQADVMWAAARKFATFRMLAARDTSLPAPALMEFDRLQLLLGETSALVKAGSALALRQMVVSSADLDLSKEALNSDRRMRDQLFKARQAAEDAARQALLALPIDQSETATPEERADRVWDAMARGMPGKPMVEATANRTREVLPAIPLRLERRKRYTLLREPAYRMAITDSGTTDEMGRHIFYQEEWVQRSVSVIRFRWRVAVETATGQHILVRRYNPIERQGSLDDLYAHRDRDALWYLEPAADATEPGAGQLDAAIDQVSQSREAIRSAAQDFKTAVRAALAKQPELDSGMPDDLRETVFAIRAHIARVTWILKAERNVRSAIDNGEMAIRNLEPMAAWFNRGTSAEGFQTLERADREIDSLRGVETQAASYLPSDTTLSQDTFPALRRNLIVRIRSALDKKVDKNQKDQAVRCLQEVWGMESSISGTREVRRTATLIVIDPYTGMQTRIARGTSFYKMSPGVVLEEIYDEYAADNVSMELVSMGVESIPGKSIVGRFRLYAVDHHNPL